MPKSRRASTVLGPHFHLYKSPEPTRRLIITAIGRELLNRPLIQIPVGSVLYTYHKNGNSNVDFSLDEVGEGTVPPAAAVMSGGCVRQYALEKYAADDHRKADCVAGDHLVDVVAVRHRRGIHALSPMPLTTLDLFKELKKAGLNYEVIEVVYSCFPWANSFRLHPPSHSAAYLDASDTLFLAQSRAMAMRRSMRMNSKR